ncbi:hypothetical protein GCM10018771_72520 [Streptomyces cellulosae]|nr:hypothetical protein GCM10018771_72520 [Streptomyces cellulosae]
MPVVRTLLFEVGRDRVDTVLAADAGVLNTTEGHRTADGAIGGDPDSAGADALRDAEGTADVGPPHSCAQALTAVVGDGAGFVLVEGVDRETEPKTSSSAMCRCCGRR